MNISKLNNMLNVENEQVFVMFIGCPGTGKTNCANEIKKLYSDDVVCVIDPDEIREEMFNTRYDQSYNSQVYSAVYSRIEEALESNAIVVYNAPNIIQNFREKIIRHVKSTSGAIIIGVVFDASLIECWNKVSEYENPIPYDILENMYINYKLKLPSLKEGFDILFKQSAMEEWHD